jgi:hypothetical protein
MMFHTLEHRPQVEKIKDEGTISDDDEDDVDEHDGQTGVTKRTKTKMDGDCSGKSG